MSGDSPSLASEYIHVLNKYCIHEWRKIVTMCKLQVVLTMKLEFQGPVSRRTNLKVMEWTCKGQVWRNVDVYLAALTDPPCPVLHTHESDAVIGLLVHDTEETVWRSYQCCPPQTCTQTTCISSGKQENTLGYSYSKQYTYSGRLLTLVLSGVLDLFICIRVSPRRWFTAVSEMGLYSEASGELMLYSSSESANIKEWHKLVGMGSWVTTCKSEETIINSCQASWLLSRLEFVYICVAMVSHVWNAITG